MTVALARDVADFVQDQVRAGASTDASELVNDVIRSLREQRQPPFEITPELEAWLLEAADQPATPLTRADFEGIRQRVRSRVESSPAGAFTSPTSSSRTWSASLSGTSSMPAGKWRSATPSPWKPTAG